MVTLFLKPIVMLLQGTLQIKIAQIQLNLDSWSIDFLSMEMVLVPFIDDLCQRLDSGSDPC